MSPRTTTIISASLAAALSLALGACASDDVGFPDGGGNGGNDAAAVTCSVPVGSCSDTSNSLCQDYAGMVPAGTAQQECTAAGNTWSSAPCSTTNTSGGCRFEQPAGTGGTWCATTWFFPPTTTETVIAACPAPGIYIPPS
ncbi:MAG TPA: hypothetical protein VM261_11085 [Kofleriaceae bacterium]|nr:hypothetical protein [Kofleriaceae bacterium]